MTGYDAPIPQVPLDRVTQVLYSKIHAAMAEDIRELSLSDTLSSRWAFVVSEFQSSLPKLKVEAYSTFLTGLGTLSELFKKAADTPLSFATKNILLQFIEHDLPRIAAIAVKLNEPEAPKFFSAITEGKAERFITSFQTPDIKPKTKISKNDLNTALSGIVKSRCEEAQRLIQKDLNDWLTEQGIFGDDLDVVAENNPQYLFRQEGAKWKVIFNGCTPFYLNDTLGARYLGHLFHHPNNPIHALELESAVKPEKATVRTAETPHKLLDAKARRQYEKKLQQLVAERGGMGETASEMELGEIEGEIDALNKILLSKEALVASDAGEKARNNVRKAIVSVSSTLRSLDERGAKPLEQHISQCLSLGYTLNYNKPETIVWG